MSEIYYNCLRCKDRRVRILTRDGRRYSGTVVGVDYNNVYLRPDARGVVTTSAFYPGFYGNQILTLSLFTLLAIALI
ncbi:hypothetical protein [Paenibacillus fonticola]|uniref:hypothetical protein n=1 Tax=Paenibacillus fonticola TaxID=379896 RepID=UPI000377520B|nr:hypothetical protein [Paenibacillus fonticola]